MLRQNINQIERGMDQGNFAVLPELRIGRVTDRVPAGGQPGLNTGNTFSDHHTAAWFATHLTGGM